MIKSVHEPQSHHHHHHHHQQQQPSSMDSSDSGTTTGSSEYAYRPLTTKHRRAGSTGTTGDEEYTTDEDELYGDEIDCSTNGIVHPHPILKNDLARAATDLFGYDKRRDEEELDEPTSLFDDDDGGDVGYCHVESSAKPISIFAYNNGNENPRLPRCVLSRRRSDSSAKTIASTKSSDAHKCTLKNRRASLAEEKFPINCNGDVRASANDKLARQIDCNGEDATTAKTGTKTENATTNEPEIVTRLKQAESTDDDESTKNDADVDDDEEDDDDPPSPSTEQWSRAVAEVKEQAIAKLQEELRRAHEELKLKDEEVARLSRIRQDVEAEIEELTASLFQEAHNMVREANQRQATAERLFEESRMKSEVLAAEVTALKTLVLTSTPARPNPHLHPQIACNAGNVNSVNTDNGDAHHHHHNHVTQSSIFAKKHRRSPSHFNLKYGRENSPPDSPQKETMRASLPCEHQCGRDAYERDLDRDRDADRDRKRERERDKDNSGKDLGLEVDPRVHGEFLRWKANACVDKSDPFVARIFREDIDLCLDFPNTELGAKVRQAVLDGIIFVEAVNDKAKLGFPKKCALLEAPRQCHYRMRMGDQENQWHCISQICRNRIIAVCDFLNYLRYIERGLVKSSVHDVYWEITRLRKEMVLARLGLALSV